MYKYKVLSTNLKKSLKIIKKSKDVIDENVGQGCMLLSDRTLAHIHKRTRKNCSEYI